jgi:hypothetical protein
MLRAHLRAGRRRNDLAIDFLQFRGVLSESVWQAVSNFSTAAEARPKARRRVPPRDNLEQQWNAVVTGPNQEGRRGACGRT